MRLGLVRAWDRRTASVILGVISAGDSRDHEEHKRNASTAAVGELPTWVRLQRNMNCLFEWGQQRSLSLTSPTAPALTQSALLTRNWRQTRSQRAGDQGEENYPRASRSVSASSCNASSLAAAETPQAELWWDALLNIRLPFATELQWHRP